MLLTQWLPVGLIPEQRLVTLVRGDVVYHRRRGRASLLLAHDAQRVLLQEREPSFAPPGAVPPAGCAAASHTLTHSGNRMMLTSPADAQERTRRTFG